MSDLPAIIDYERGDGGSFIVRRDGEVVIEVVPMIFNWRLLVATEDAFGRWYEHGYCYFGTGPDALLRALAAAEVWDDPLNTEPVGYDKKAF